MTRQAKCCCGHATISLSGEPMVNGICRCTNCKQRTGSAFGWSIYFADGDVVETSDDMGVYEILGNNPQVRSFCLQCGTTLFWKSDGFKGMTGVAGGCFAENSLPEPTVSLANGTCLTWLNLPADWEYAD